MNSNNNIKNGIIRVKNTLIRVLIVGILVIGILDIFLPKTSQADFLFDNYAFLTNISTSQENTIFSTSTPVKSPQVVKNIKMVVTAYSSTPGETDSTPFLTASGKIVTDGIVANNLLSFGTKVRIPDLYGDKIFVVQDRMNSKKGKYHLDIWMPNQSEAKKFGAEITNVEVLEN